MDYSLDAEEVPVKATVAVYPLKAKSALIKHNLLVHLPPRIDISLEELIRKLRNDYDILKRTKENNIINTRIEIGVFHDGRNFVCDTDVAWRKVAPYLVENMDELIGKYSCACSFLPNN